MPTMSTFLPQKAHPCCSASPRHCCWPFCKPTLAKGHGYIIIAMDYFTKWAKAMPTYVEYGKTAALFLCNHIIARFGVPQSIVTDHGSHFHNQMMEELSAKLGFHHENSTPYYLQANG